MKYGAKLLINSQHWIILVNVSDQTTKMDDQSKQNKTKWNCVHISWNILSAWIKAGTSNYIPQILWDVITCPCLWYLFWHTNPQLKYPSINPHHPSIMSQPDIVISSLMKHPQHSINHTNNMPSLLTSWLRFSKPCLQYHISYGSRSIR